MTATSHDPIPNGVYHRNGVSGAPFHVATHPAGNSLTIQFSTDTPNREIRLAPIQVPYRLIETGINTNRTGQTSVDNTGAHRPVGPLHERATYVDANIAVVVFDDTSNNDSIMVAVVDLTAPTDGAACAVFNAELVYDGEHRFGANSWRGDRYAPHIQQFIDTATKSTLP